MLHQPPDLKLALQCALLAELEATLRVVTDQADDPSNRVHAARKHLKRWRALFQLAPKPTRIGLQRQAHVVQMVARKLGGVRDPVAQLETWRQFVKNAELVDGA